MNNENLTNKILSLARNYGATLIGISNLNEYKDNVKAIPPDLLEDFESAISIAIALPLKAIHYISIESPGPLYAHAYKTVNNLLDHIAYKLSQYLISKGYNAQPIPASLTIDYKNYLGNIPHKTFAYMSGLGWIGRNLLLINPKYGPRIRLATILTNAKLNATGKPIPNQCGNCTKCIEACPVGALKPSNFKYYPLNRNEILDVKKCGERLSEMMNKPNIGVPICGLCIKACPIGLK